MQGLSAQHLANGRVGDMNPFGHYIMNSFLAVDFADLTST